MATLRERFQRWIAPRAKNPEDAQREYIITIILLGLAIPGFLFGLASLTLWLFRGGPFWIGAAAGFGVQPFYILSYWLNRRGRARAAAYMMLAALVLVMLGGGLRVGLGHSVMVGYAMIVAIAGLVLGFWAALVFALICGGSYALIGWMQVSSRLLTALSPGETLLADLAAIITGLMSLAVILWVAEFQLRLALRREQRLSAELRQTVNTLEDIVKQRTADLAHQTADLARRTAQLEAAAYVARRAAEIRDVDTLLDETVRLISDRFGFYHAGIFLIDDAGEYAVLRAASSEGGQRMLARGHRLAVGKVGIVGTVAGTGKPRIALDVGKDAVFFDNPDLPRTRSEMALPLKVGERVIGVLDVQSEEPAAFTDEDVAVLQTMADQIALAIENARLLEESRRAVQELQRLYGEQARDIWARIVAARPAAYRYTGADVEPLPKPVPLAGGEDGRRLAVPIRLWGQTIGSILLQRTEEQPPWSPEERQLAEEIGEQIALALENARLLEETEARAARERMLSEMTSRLTRSLDMDALLDTAVRELARLPEVAEVAVYVGGQETVSSPSRGPRSRGGRHG